MFSFTVTKTHTCLHGWSILFMKPNRLQSNSGLYRELHMPYLIKRTRKNTPGKSKNLQTATFTDMKQILTYLLFIWILLPLKAEEKIYTVDNIPKVHLQNKMQYVCNPAGILSQQACDEIDAMLYALEQQTGIETVVAIVPSIGDKDCFEFSHQLLNQWGVGKKGKDNGLVILLVTDQRCIQFYTGYGLEGILPDAICKRIQMQEMIPYLKKGEWNQGMLAGVKAVCQRLDGSMVNDDEGRGEEGISVSMLLVVILGLSR